MIKAIMSNLQTMMCRQSVCFFELGNKFNIMKLALALFKNIGNDSLQVLQEWLTGLILRSIDV